MTLFGIIALTILLIIAMTVLVLPQTSKQKIISLVLISILLSYVFATLIGG
jgi:hypothetical protein